MSEDDLEAMAEKVIDFYGSIRENIERDLL